MRDEFEWLSRLAPDGEPEPRPSVVGQAGSEPERTWRDDLRDSVRAIGARLARGGRAEDHEKGALTVYHKHCDVLRAADLLGIRRPRVMGPAWALEADEASGRAHAQGIALIGALRAEGRTDDEIRDLFLGAAGDGKEQR